MPLYSRAPIKEVIFDVQVAGGTSSVWELDDGLRQLSSRYSQKHEIVGGPSFEFTFGPSTQPNFNVGPSLIGLRYATEDGMRQFQARLDGFSFNHVSNAAGEYDSWESFSAGAREAWDIYLARRKPQHITRVGLRYINYFDLGSASQTVSLSDYFVLRPIWNTEEFATAGGFHLQLSFPQPDGAILLITQGTAPQEGSSSVLLDVDAFYDGLRLSVEDTNELWNRAQELRRLKNKAFDSCLQEKAKDLIR